jgi:hypothetical protein
VVVKLWMTGATPPPTGAAPGGTFVLSDTVQPAPAVPTVNMRGRPAKPAPAVMDTAHRVPSTEVVTRERPLASSGAS